MFNKKKKEQELVKAGVLLVLDILESLDEDDNIASEVADRLMGCVAGNVKVNGKDFPLYKIVDDWCLDNNIDIS